MDLHHLRCFVTVAEELHFGRAARRLHLTASPVSRAVMDLEREVGTLLFIRRHHSIQMTVAGLALLPKARIILAEVDGLRKLALREAASKLSVGVTFLAPPAQMDEFIASIVDASNGRMPQITMAYSSDLSRQLETGQIEIALAHLPVDSAKFDHIVLNRVPLAVAVRSGHALAERKELRLADLAGQIFLMFPKAPSSRAVEELSDVLKKKGITVHAVREPSHALIASQVRTSNAMSLAPPTWAGGVATTFDDPGITVIPLADELFVETGMIWRRDETTHASGTTEIIRSVVGSRAGVISQ